MRFFRYLLLLTLVSLGAYLTYTIHISHPYPYHHDEWQHIALARQIVEEDYSRQFNPYLGIELEHADLEIGFHILLAEFMLLTGADLIMVYQYIAALTFMLTALLLYLIVERLSGKWAVAIYSVIFYASLRSNINILGKDYFVPLTLGLPLMLLSLNLFLSGLQERRTHQIYAAAAVSAGLFLIHPPSLMILAFPVAFELFLHFKDAKMAFTKRHLISSMVLAAFFVLYMWRGSFESTMLYLRDLLYFERGWGQVEVTYSIPLLYGLVATLLAVVGFIGSNRSGLRSFSALAFIALAVTAFFNIFNFTFLIPYSRAVHYALLGMVPLSAAGLHGVLERFRLRSEKHDIALKATVLLVVFYLTFTSTYALDQKYKKYSFDVVDDHSLAALLHSESLGDNLKLITPYFSTSAVYPVTGHQSISLIPALMGGGMMDDNYEFYSYDCDRMWDSVQRSNATHIISQNRIECSWLEMSFSNEKSLLYRIR
jgi:hypothetical protein